MDHKDSVLASLETLRLGELAAGGTGRFKSLAYKKAMDGIRKMEGPLTSAEQVKGLPGVGEKIYEKVVEILETGGLKAAERMKERTNVVGLSELLGVHGIGPVKAKALIAAGIRDVAGLKVAATANPKLLTESQRLGLKYYEAGLQRIPREEMVQHETKLIEGIPGGLKGTVVGSYRRGAASSGDIDMLISYTGGVKEKEASSAFKEFVSRLETNGYIIDTLVSGEKKWMGYVRIGDGLARRLDLMLTPPKEFAYAILYFTGSDKFNIAFRRYCLEHGYTLNEHTMKPVKEGDNIAVPLMADERDIFTFMGLTYVNPTERVGEAQIIPIE